MEEKDDWKAGMRGGIFAMTKEPSKVKVKDSAYRLGRGGGWSKVLIIWQGERTEELLKWWMKKEILREE